MHLQRNAAHRRSLRRASLAAGAALVAALLNGPPAAAQVLTPEAAATLAAPPGCAAMLTDPCLLSMLQQLGFTPKPLKHGYLLVQPHGTWTINIQALVSPDGRKLGFNANLGLVTEAEVSAAQWKALLAANQEIDPSSFYYDPVAGKLYLHRSVDTRQVTPANLLREVTGFSNGLVSTEILWKFTH
jgi:hypothetical protein